MKKAFIVIGVMALVILGAVFFLPSWLAARPILQVTNVDGQAVDVVPWVSGPSIPVACGQTRNIDTSNAPGQPWLVTVTSQVAHRVLLRQEGSGPLEVIVRSGGVAIGAPAPSVGPASAKGCPAAP
jgi:hypothetical protein